jgi:hypothetical protein
MTRLRLITFVLLWLLAAAAAGPRAPLPPYETSASLTPDNQIDKLVLEALERHGLSPSFICSDAVFVRRVFLDAIGTLPTLQETRDFLNDPSPDKRRVLIDRLLERPEFADYWAMKWSHLLRVKAEFPINLWPNAAQAYHRWIRDSLRANKPCDQFARELLTTSGSNFRDPPVNFYRAVPSRDPQSLAQAVALTFMGCRAENWPREKLDGMLAFFSRLTFKPTGEWKEEIVLFDQGQATTKPAAGIAAIFPDGTRITLSPDVDPRETFADWLIAPGNPWFARNIANRTWFWLQGRGIVHEPDDVRPDNPPCNPRLLDYLAGELVAHHYDLKHLYRLILNSKTYQLSAIPAAPAAASDHAVAVGEAYFADYPLRRLDAEVLIDALDQITGASEKYTSAIPEPYTFIPASQRTILLPDGSITSAFLELFGRPPRDTGAEAERNNRPSAQQCLHLLNSSHIQQKIERSPQVLGLAQSGKLSDAIDRVYLTILSRHPTEPEMARVARYAQSASKREVVIDLVWALINSDEFLYRH